jgi:hypothetical protein
MTMKFVGGTHHGCDVPIMLRLVIHATRARRIDVCPRVGWETSLRIPSVMPCGNDLRETYRVATWRSSDRTRSKFLARAGLTRDEIQALAARLFR